jgi:hypothetical protein
MASGLRKAPFLECIGNIGTLLGLRLHSLSDKDVWPSTIYPTENASESLSEFQRRLPSHLCCTELCRKTVFSLQK